MESYLSRKLETFFRLSNSTIAGMVVSQNRGQITIKLFYLVTPVRGGPGGDCAVVSHIGLVNDQLTFALAQILDFNTIIWNDGLTVDEEFNW